MNALVAIGKRILEYVLGQLLVAAIAYFKALARKKQIEDEAKQSTDPLKQAVTGDEIDQATDDTLNHL